MGLKVLALPLLVLGVLAVLNVSGFGAAVGGDAPYQNLGETGAASGYGYFDSTGVQVAYANGTLLSGVEGQFYVDYRASPPHGDLINSTGVWELVWVHPETSIFTIAGGTITVVGVLAVVVGMAVLASFQILSSGISDTGVSAIVKGSFFAFVFLVVGTQGGALLTKVPVVGGLMYLMLSLVYVVGTVDMFGHPSGA